MKNWPAYKLTELYNEYLTEYLKWREINFLNGHSESCGCPSIKERDKYAALTQLMVALANTQGKNKRRKKEEN